MSRGQIRLRWIITCGDCGQHEEFYGLSASGSQQARRAGWSHTLLRGYICPQCAAQAEAPVSRAEQAA